MRRLRMKFRKDSEYWYVEENQVKRYELVNGDPLWIQVGDIYYSSCIEWDEEWFITLGKKKFWLHRKTQYWVLWDR